MKNKENAQKQLDKYENLRQTFSSFHGNLEKLKLEKSKVEKFENFQKDLLTILSIDTGASFSKIIKKVQNLSQIRSKVENLEKNHKDLEAENMKNKENAQKQLDKYNIAKSKLKDLLTRFEEVSLESDNYISKLTKEKEGKFKELSEMIEQKDQKLSIQKAKCEEFEIQQNKLMDLFQNVPNEQRNFLGLQENIETLKQDYINEKERADNLATNLLDIPPACDHSKFDEEILKLKESNAKLKKAIGVLVE